MLIIPERNYGERNVKPMDLVAKRAVRPTSHRWPFLHLHDRGSDIYICRSESRVRRIVICQVSTVVVSLSGNICSL